jgi:hypothetical protein
MDDIIYSNLVTKNTCTGVNCCEYECLGAGFYSLVSDICSAPEFYSCADSIPGACNEGDRKKIDCTPI